MIGSNFFLAFSPERVDPGNKQHTTATIQKSGRGNAGLYRPRRGAVPSGDEEGLRSVEPSGGGDGEASGDTLS